MTLSQRLTRAGAVFILLGSAIAVLPKQNDVALADDNCNPNGTTYRLSNSSTPSNNLLYSYIEPGLASGTAPSFYAYKSTNSGSTFAAVAVTSFSAAANYPAFAQTTVRYTGNATNTGNSPVTSFCSAVFTSNVTIQDNFSIVNPPQNPKAVPDTISTGVTISSDSVTGANAYRFERATSSGGEMASISQANKPTSTYDYTADSSAGNTKYYYIVQTNTFSSGTYGSPSNEVSALTVPAAVTSPLAAASSTSGQVNVSWTASAGGTDPSLAYVLSRKIGSGSYTTIYTGANTAFTDTVPSGSACTYQIVATNSSGNLTTTPPTTSATAN